MASHSLNGPHHRCTQWHCLARLTTVILVGPNLLKSVPTVSAASPKMRRSSAGLVARENASARLRKSGTSLKACTITRFLFDFKELRTSRPVRIVARQVFAPPPGLVDNVVHAVARDHYTGFSGHGQPRAAT